MTIIKDIYKAIFGKNYDQAWKQFATENNATYNETYNSVEITYANHKILFDTHVHYSVSGGQSFDTAYTRVRVEFISPDNLRFRLTKQVLIDGIGKLLGAQDIQIGDKEFDKRFLIKGNDEFKVQTLLSNNTIKNLILQQSDISLHLLDNEGIFEDRIPEGLTMLYYVSETVIKETKQLTDLLNLYKNLIDQLTKLGSAKALKTN